MTCLGPLRLSHEDLWRLSWGEIEDLLYAYRYREYLDAAKRAQQAAWIMNASGNLKHPVRVEDLVGHWVDGHVMSKSEYFEYCKNRIQRNKERRRKGGDD